MKKKVLSIILFTSDSWVLRIGAGCHYLRSSSSALETLAAIGPSRRTSDDR